LGGGGGGQELISLKPNRRPLGDSTTVKKKFDDMFASTRYTQAIKEMGSLKDAKAIDLKIAKQKLADLEVHKTKAAEIKQKIDDDKRRIRDNNADADQMQRDLDELASQITELEGQLAELDSVLLVFVGHLAGP